MRHSNKRGFTLLEVIISVALMALILIPVLSLLITNSRSIITARENSNIQSEAQQVMTSLKNNCLYTKNIESCKVIGSERKDDINYTIPDNTPYVITLRQPIKASPGYKDIKYEYKTDNGGEFYIDNILISKGANVKITPIYPDSSEANKTFAKAVGVNVDISLSSTHPGTHKTSKIDNLSNSFYFRNNESMSFLSFGSRTNGGDDPTPYPTLSPGNGGNSGGGGSGESGGSGDSGESESPAPSSSSSPTPTSPTPSSTPTPTSPAPTKTPIPTSAPTQTPTPTQTPIPNNSASIRIDCDGTYWRVYDSSGTLKHTYEIPSWQSEFRLEFYEWGIQSWWFQWSPTLSDYGITNYATSSMDITFTGSGTTPIGVLVSNNFAKFSIRNNSSYIVTVQNTACTNAYVTFPGQPTEKLPNDSATYSILPSSN